MQRLAATVILLVLTMGCNTPQSPRGSTVRTGQGESPLAIMADWLDPGTEIHQATVASIPGDSDVRQALYVVMGDERDRNLALRTRNYSVRRPARPDQQQLLLVSLDSKVLEYLQVDNDWIPVRLVSSPERNRVCAALLSQTGVGSLMDERVKLGVWQSRQDPQYFDIDALALPVGFHGDEELICTKLRSLQIDGGQLVPTADRTSDAFSLNLASGEMQPVNSYFRKSPENRWAATYAVEFDPITPEQAQIEYTFSAWLLRDRGSASKLKFPYHVTYTPFAWEPPIVWLDDDTAATIAFLPDAAGGGSRQNYSGLFRLVSFAAPEFEPRLVEDRLPGDLPVLAGDGVMFYSLRQTTPDGPQWEIWAADAGGLRKQRIWRAPESVYVSVEDYFEGRLLVARQYMNTAGGEKKLYHELLEFGHVELGYDSGPLILPNGSAEMAAEEYEDPPAEPGFEMGEPGRPAPGSAPSIAVP